MATDLTMLLKGAGIKPQAIYRLREVCQLLRVSRQTILRHIELGDFPAFRVGSQYRVFHHDLARWLVKQESAAA